MLYACASAQVADISEGVGMSEPLHFTRRDRFTRAGFLRTWCNRSVVRVRYALADNAKPYDLVTFRDWRPRTPWCSRCVQAMGKAQNAQSAGHDV